jgi:hypothetical protein
LKADVIPECSYPGYGFKTSTIFPIKPFGMTGYFVMLVTAPVYWSLVFQPEFQAGLSLEQL